MKLSGSDTEYELQQWANDWISTDREMLIDGRPRTKKGDWVPGVVDPARCIFNADEVETLEDDRARAQEVKDRGGVPITGFFWDWWELRTVGVNGGRIGFLVCGRR